MIKIFSGYIRLLSTVINITNNRYIFIDIMKKINYETCIYLAKENSDTKIYETKNKIKDIVV